MAESVIAAGALYRAPAAGAVSVTSTLSFFAQAAEIGSNSPSVTKSNVTEAFSPIDPPPEGLRKLDSNAYARGSGGHLCGCGQKLKETPRSPAARRPPCQGGRSKQSQLLEAQVELAAGPGVGRGVGDLRRLQVPRGPVGGPVAFRDAEAEEVGGEVANTTLADAAVTGYVAEVDHRGLLETEHQLELAKIVRQGDAGLDDERVGEQLRELPGAVEALQREQVHGARGGDLHQAGQVALALAERGPRLGVEADHAFLPDVGHRPLQVLGRLDELYRALVAPDRELVDVPPGDRAAKLVHFVAWYR